MSKVLIIGAPFTYQYIDVELLKEQEINPILLYPQGHAVLAGMQSLFYQDLNYHSLKALIERNPVDYIVCFNDNFLLQVAELRAHFNLPGIKGESMHPFKIKSSMYEALRGKVTIPEYMKVDSNTSYQHIQAFLGNGVYFIKPDDLAGAKGTSQINNEDDFIDWQHKTECQQQHYIIQKYCASELYHCEMIVANNDIKYVQARKYSYPNHRFLEGKIIASLPIKDKGLKEKIEHEAINVQRQLNFTSGVMHTEFFVNEQQELLFLETNIRAAGGAINQIHHARAGVSLETAMILLEAGHEVTVSNSKDIYYVSGYVPRKKGLVTRINNPNLKGTYEFNHRLSEGQEVESPISASDAALSFVGFSNEVQHLYDDFNALEQFELVSYSNN